MAYKGPEKRIDPENRMGQEWHSPRALGRKEFEGLNPEARRKAILEAKFRNEGPHVGEAENIRVKLLRALDRLEGKRTPEQENLLKFLESQIEAAALVWLEKFPVHGAPPKDRFVEAGQKWLASLSPETLEGLLELCPKMAKLIIVPPITVQEQMNLIDRNKTIPGQTDGIIRWPEGWKNVRAPTWKFGITDGREDMPFDPTIYWKNPGAPEDDEREARTNEKMVAEYERRFSEHGLKLMPQYGYVPSAANALAQREVFDRQFYTAFKRPPGAAFLPDSNWYGDRVYLGGRDPGDSDLGLRCRPWVEGEIT